MKEFIGCSVNIGLVELESGAFGATAEVVLVLSEPNYSVSSAGEMVRSREVSHLRFGSRTRGLRALIKSLGEYADEMDATEKRCVVVQGSNDEAAA